MNRLTVFLAALTVMAPCAEALQSTTPPSPPEHAAQQPAAQAPVLTERQKAEMQADLLMGQKQYSEAVAAYSAILKQEPKNLTLLNKAGVACQGGGDFHCAERFYKKALKAQKNNSTALNNLGTLEYNWRKYRKAIRYYEKAIQSQGDVATYYSNLGYAQFDDKQVNAAINSFQKAIQLDPDIFTRRGGTGAVVQQRGMDDPGSFYFFVAKSFALSGDAEHCAHFLKMSRDEGYKDYLGALKDPAFAKVIKDPRVREILEPQKSDAQPSERPLEL
ncbi:MAG: tetratricopeptide repeat protein [Candidatus Acidiferrales bacterium]